MLALVEKYGATGYANAEPCPQGLHRLQPVRASRDLREGHGDVAVDGVAHRRTPSYNGRMAPGPDGECYGARVEVLLTIDTEVHPCTDRWRETALAAEMDQYLFGRTPQGEYGLAYQLEVLKRHRLKAVFFFEALFAIELGPEAVRPIVASIREAGHEVQLHVHTEWLSYLEPPLLGSRRGTFMHDFSEDEQSLIVSRAMESLAACGSGDVRAFRAGNYGADLHTLRALARNGIDFDSSWNAAYLGGACRLEVGSRLLAPQRMEGVWEVPIGFFHGLSGARPPCSAGCMLPG